LTDLSAGPGPANARLRREAFPHVTAAARAAGARRLIVESIAFPPAPESAAAVAALEQDAQTSGLESLVIRFGLFWGPGTWQATPPKPPAIEVGAAGLRAAALIVSNATGIAIVADP
jgi:hypothetical protein